MSATDEIDLVINAGGLSRRMGRVKALLPVPPDAAPLIVHIARRLLPLVTGRVIVVTNEASVAKIVHQAFDAFVLPDQWEAGGALGGLASGLAHCHGWAMVVACDMPLVSPAIFAKLLALANAEPQHFAIIPHVNGQGQPFHGLWHIHSLPILAGHLAARNLAVHRALDSLPVRWAQAHELAIDASYRAFFNVNTPSDWDEFLALWGETNGPVTT
jgi:molybdopterin-guanine dinucleotide biosynthesis protein A